MDFFLHTQIFFPVIFHRVYKDELEIVFRHKKKLFLCVIILCVLVAYREM